MNKNDVVFILIAIVIVVAILMLIFPGSQFQLEGAESISRVSIRSNWFYELFQWLMCWEGSEVCYAQ